MEGILLIGNGAREHVIAETLKKNKQAKIYACLKSKNPGIIALSESFEIGSYRDLAGIRDFARKVNPAFAFIGPEEPLSNGVVDLLNGMGINAVGPSRSLARLETSKSFTRSLLRKYNISGNPKFEVFSERNISYAKKFIDGLAQCVVKPDGLTGGKGVKVQGDHLKSKKEALEYCREVLQTHPAVVVEEKVEGEEFSLQCFADGRTVIAMPPVQDHKRAFADDKGSNTGGMGSYSCENHLLPFLTKKDVEEGVKMTQKVAEAIYNETGEFYKGVMYAGLIAAKGGIKLLEYNARFGDPEAMNVLPLMETDFAEVCKSVIEQNLHRIKIKFRNKATVCKYIVPEGYPDSPAKNKKIRVGQIPQGARIYYASVEQREDGLYTTNSRAIACLGIGDTLETAEKAAEGAASCIKGRVFHRKDIGTRGLIHKKVEHMKMVRG